MTSRPLILGESGETLELVPDIPSCKADLFYIHGLAYGIEADGRVTWQSEVISQQVGEN